MATETVWSKNRFVVLQIDSVLYSMDSPQYQAKEFKLIYSATTTKATPIFLPFNLKIPTIVFADAFLHVVITIRQYKHHESEYTVYVCAIRKDLSSPM